MESNLTADIQPREQGAARGRLFRLDSSSNAGTRPEAKPGDTRPTVIDMPPIGIPNTMAWSPDGRRIAFVSNTVFQSDDIE